jgi:hypothetical protein
MSFLSSLFGFGGSQPRTQQVVQTSRLPEEVAPFAKEVLEEAKELYKQRMEEGYDPYTGQTVAPFTPEQEQAMAGIAGLVGTQRPLQEEALGMLRAGGEEKFTPEVAQEYMSPYQRAVTDIEKREAQRVFESQIMPQFEKQAVAAGGMSGLGTRAGVQASELGRAQMQRLGDIEAKGLQTAYQDAQNLFTQQQARERAAAQDIGKMAPAMFGSGLAEQGALQTVGEQKRDLGQEALNEAYFRHLEKQAFPQEQLAGYSGFVYGNPLMQQRTATTTQPAPMGPSRGSQLLNMGMSAAALYGMGGGAGFGGPGFSLGNLFRRKEGGGLSSLPVVYRKHGDPVETSSTDLTSGQLAELEKRAVAHYKGRLPTAAQLEKRGKERAADVETQRAIAEKGRRGDLARHMARLSAARQAGKEKIGRGVGASPWLALLKGARETMRPSGIAGQQRGLLDVLGSAGRETAISLAEQRAAAAKEKSRTEEKMLPGELEDIKTEIKGETEISEGKYKAAMDAINKRHDVKEAAAKLSLEEIKLIAARVDTQAKLFAAILKAGAKKGYAPGMAGDDLNEWLSAALGRGPTGRRRSISPNDKSINFVRARTKLKEILAQIVPHLPAHAILVSGSHADAQRQYLKEHPELIKEIQKAFDAPAVEKRARGGSIEEDVVDVEDMTAASDVLSDVEWLNT